MEQKLQILYDSCVKELNSIGINLSSVGQIDIKLSKRANKRYGCCKHEMPDEIYKKIYRQGFKKIIKYEKFNIKKESKLNTPAAIVGKNIINNSCNSYLKNFYICTLFRK